MDGEKRVEQMLGMNEVVVSIAGMEDALGKDKQCARSSSSKNNQINSPNTDPNDVRSLTSNVKTPKQTSTSPPEKPKSSSTATPTWPSKIPVKTGESPLLPHSSNLDPIEVAGKFVRFTSPDSSPIKISPTSKTNSRTPKGNVRSTSITVETLPKDDEDEDDDDEDDDVEDDGNIYDADKAKDTEKRNNKVSVLNLIEFAVFVCITAVFITSLSVETLRHHKFWGLETWRWCVLVLVIFCGNFFTEWCINGLVFLIERHYVLKKKVLYFVFSLKRSVQVFMWFALVLLAWVILIKHGLKQPKETTWLLRHVTRFLVSCLFGAGMWMVKTLLVKILACAFHVKRFFDRIQDSIFHQYVLLILSEPQQSELDKVAHKIRTLLSFKKLIKGKIVKEQVVDVMKLNKLIKEKISAWTISGLVDVIQGSGHPTISSSLDGSGKITSEKEARKAGNNIFTNVAKRNPRYIDEEDLLQYFIYKEEVNRVLDMFKGASGTRKINKPTMRKWVVKVYKERELLAQSLNDAKTAIEDLNKVLSGITLVVIIVVWLVLMGLATTEMIVFISSQLVLAAFIFGNTCKTVFECVVFIFVMHPFDMGDHCIIDGVQMTVEEMNILTTVFKSDKELITYPNSVLATKPISTYYQSPEMLEKVEFVIDVSTPADTIADLKSKIKEYIEEKPKQWHPDHSFKEIKIGNKMKMVLYVNPTTNIKDLVEKSNRRPDLLSELKKIFEELEIKYHYLPQESYLSNVAPDCPTTANASC